MKRIDLSVYLVLDPGLCAGLGMVETALAAVKGGVTVVQLRDKDASTEQRIEIGRALKLALSGTGATLIMNDDVEAALAIGADGLHIGQDDMPAAEARARIGSNMLLGQSVESVTAAARVDAAIINYVGVGPVFATPTKADHKTPIGFDGLAQILRHAPVPAVAIGGLKREHAVQTIAAGAQGMAVVSAICGQSDPQQAAADIVAAITEARQ
ncbi:thiamine phosphate synthase [Qingshengfaniella alkalisoli]|uniref:Thiamine-phosphate synthase n=1 Tax=Qingshengfaniella alkalisoli TaxID=2599296 RepID=A0A5B8ISD3_9RHOB|nr:thiamine phosphate synthase [Qingshengfaniella alkalisoli]QDY68333.1 thiamine phosphate synthase [Qingshengfaniella alkalisoli]